MDYLSSESTYNLLETTLNKRLTELAIRIVQSEGLKQSYPLWKKEA